MNQIKPALRSSVRNLLLKRDYVYLFYIVLAIIATTKQYLSHSFNNYLIFKHVFWHATELKSLFGLSPSEYLDSNHYGPLFSLIIAPFALLPDSTGMYLWNIANVVVLLLGIYSLPLDDYKKALIAIICSHEMLTALFSFQFNIALTGLILLSFSSIIKDKNAQSVFYILIGTLVKLYGIVGLAFFFFTRKKTLLILSGLILTVILFAAPMLISSPEYIIQCYADWYNSLVHKNLENASLTSYQDISLMGMARRLSGNEHLPNWPFLAGGLALFALPYLRISQYKKPGFRLMLLASVLIFTVIFSSGSESPTYIIAFAGVAIWFVIQPYPKTQWQIALLVFALILTSLSPSDLFPKFLRENYVRPYSLKALPCIFIWITIIYQLITDKFDNYLNPKSNHE